MFFSKEDWNSALYAKRKMMTFTSNIMPFFKRYIFREKKVQGLCQVQHKKQVLAMALKRKSSRTLPSITREYSASIGSKKKKLHCLHA